MQINTLHELFLNELRDLYSVENQIIGALPKMIDAASDEKLRTKLSEHLKVTQEQLQRLEEINQEFPFQTVQAECLGMKGVLAEGAQTLAQVVDPATKNAAIIISAQRVEHYEMAAYGGALQFARDLGYDDAADLLQQTLDEEGAADKELSSLAQGGLFSEGLNKVAIDEEL